MLEMLLLQLVVLRPPNESLRPYILRNERAERIIHIMMGQLVALTMPIP